MQYVIIGNSAAGVSAAEVLRKADAECDITIVSEEEYRVYNRPLIARYMGGEIGEEKLWYRPDSFYEEKRIHLYRDTQAVRIDPKEKYIFLSNDDQLPYDRLLLATGAQPFVPPMEGLESHPNFHTFLELKNAKRVKETAGEDTEAVILGAGLIGLEVAEELRHYTRRPVHVVELAPRLLPTICNTAASEILKQTMEARGVVFHLENTVTRVEGTCLHLKDGASLPSQLFIAAGADGGGADQSGDCGQFQDGNLCTGYLRGRRCYHHRRSRHRKACGHFSMVSRLCAGTVRWQKYGGAECGLFADAHGQ